MLSQRQRRCLQAVVDRIIPADEFPSGWEAGAGDYLLRQLETDLASRLAAYRGGLDAVDEEAQRVAGRTFAELDCSLQDEILVWIEAGEVAASWPVNPIIWFHMLVDHVIEGYYGDPGNGGNRDAVSWRMIGFEVRA
jgi:hypothetical protein